MAKKTHGMTHTRTYEAWCNIISRCKGYCARTKKYYTDKDITVCEEWETFENFLADMGEKPEGMEMDRINSNKGYFKENCRWVTKGHNMNMWQCKRCGKIIRKDSL